MIARQPDTADVYADLDIFDQPQPMGSLRRQTSRTGDIFSFEYDPAWLRQPEAFTLDPDLAVSILRQSRRLFDCWPLKGA
jgi:hypothetical protein